MKGYICTKAQILPIMIISFSHPENCVHCQATNVSRIRRPTFIRSYLWFLPITHFRCFACMHKFLVLGFKAS